MCGVFRNLLCFWPHSKRYEVCTAAMKQTGSHVSPAVTRALDRTSDVLKWQQTENVPVPIIIYPGDLSWEGTRWIISIVASQRGGPRLHSWWDWGAFCEACACCSPSREEARQFRNKHVWVSWRVVCPGHMSRVYPLPSAYMLQQTPVTPLSYKECETRIFKHLH